MNLLNTSASGGHLLTESLEPSTRAFAGRTLCGRPLRPLSSQDPSDSAPASPRMPPRGHPGVHLQSAWTSDPGASPIPAATPAQIPIRKDSVLDGRASEARRSKGKAPAPPDADEDTCRSSIASACASPSPSSLTTPPRPLPQATLPAIAGSPPRGSVPQPVDSSPSPAGLDMPPRQRPPPPGPRGDSAW